MKIIIDILGKKIPVKEPSFNDYKTLLKNITTEEDIIRVFDLFLDECIYETIDLNVLEKFLLLLNLRGLILGNTLELEVENKNYSIDINDILDAFETPYNAIKKEVNGIIYTFDYQKTFNFSNDKIKFITDNLRYINDKELSIDDEQKECILPALNFNELYDSIIDELYSKKIRFNFIEEDIYLYNGIFFLKTLYTTDLLELYKLEYVCRKRLNFNFDDFNKSSLPECRILLNYHIEEVKKENEKMEELKNR